MRERYKKGATQPDRPSKQISNTKSFSYSKFQKHLNWKKKKQQQWLYYAICLPTYLSSLQNMAGMEMFISRLLVLKTTAKLALSSVI